MGEYSLCSHDKGEFSLCSFDWAMRIFERHNMAFDSDKYYILGIKSHELSLFTNLGLLLSDQCTHTVKVAVFSDIENTIFRDWKEFSGSIFKQLEETFEYLQLCNQNKSVIDGLDRFDYWDYPKEAIREALLNALIHRDYSFSGSIIINVNDTGMEFISIGGLLAGITTEDIQNGISLPRNRKLAGVFHRLHFIEAYGTGIRRIFSLYKESAVQPSIITTQNTFKMILPNINNCGRVKMNDQVYASELTPQMRTVIDYITEYGEISDIEIQSLLDIKRTRTYLLTKQMIDGRWIKAVGRGADKKYVLIGK